MKWHFADNQAKELLGIDPLQMMKDPVLVKENPVREVFKCGKLYFKHDKRFFNGLKQEFKHALRISAKGIPAIRHLAVSRHMLITESAENSIELSVFLKNDIPTAQMLESFKGFIDLLIKNNLKHSDLHCGNVLYCPDNNSFLLVDLRSADIASSAILSNAEKSCLHLVLELRRFLTREKLYPLLETCQNGTGITASEIFDRELNRQTVEFLKSWPKRKQQILSGYRKFTTIKGDMLCSSDAPDDISGAIKTKGSGAKYMLLHHYLELNHIPHRKVYAVERDTVYLEPEEIAPVCAPETEFTDFSERLAICGISSSRNDWQMTGSGKIKFINLDSAVRQSDMLEI